ncbi:Blp family class II bacteriocin [Streptococcus pluranimalium]|uniref:Bacteriocin n=1 Tax=Streptococcus pluranimalium TaxID=82348 RepID=A0A2L0D506_9STRE|nr:Blp family class II bacteriocin [Streptococcus pluranimalium]AUW96912.1 bacteriocin [Streptococcus pluranimalium]
MGELNFEQLSQIRGGGKKAADIYVSAISGAAQGAMLCAQTGVVVQPGVILGCAGAGAVLGVMFPS